MIEAVIFDFDGVIVNSFDAYAAYLKKVLTKHGYTEPSDATIRKHFYLTDRELLRVLSGERSEEKLDELADDLEHVPFESIAVAEKAKETLDRLKRYRLGIVSSARKEDVLTPLRLNGLEGYFSVVIADEDTHRHKPDPEPIRLALSRLKTLPENAVYVGDYPSDITAGKAAGAKAIYLSDEPDGREDARVDAFKEIPSAIEKIFSPHANV